MKHRIIKRTDIVKNVATTWFQRYCCQDKWYDENKQRIWEKLQQAKTVAEIDATIGNCCWTQLKCDSCECNVDILLSLEVNYDSTMMLCSNCLETFATLLKGVESSILQSLWNICVSDHSDHDVRVLMQELLESEVCS